ncbi:hypothetical protein T458_14355 [Brevibacillus panacihumi W25]|uniref:Uncharacterized protein n=1 Tax=Brevibacillus panacihumi W25 TaxID=1408254 RepID=V6M8N6_9BACL|nr:hypothetical protein T458_14355 [Brevibacillus panacihumi W25]
MNIKVLKLVLVVLFTLVIHFITSAFSIENTYTNHTVELILSLIAAILLTEMLIDTNDK